MGTLGSLDSSDACRRQYIALGQAALGEKRQGCRLHVNPATRQRFAASRLLVADVDHVGLAARIDMGQTHVSSPKGCSNTVSPAPISARDASISIRQLAATIEESIPEP